MSVERGLLLYRMGRHDGAEQEFRQVLAGEPGNAFAHSMLACCLMAKKNYAEATAEAREAIALRPQWMGGYSALAAILSAREQLGEATAAIEQAIQLDPMNAAHHAQLAGIRLKQRQWPGALAAAEAGLAVNPRNAGCANARSVSLINLGRHEEARASIDRFLQVDPLNSATHASKGWAHMHAGDYEVALEHFQESLRIDPNSPWAQSGRNAAVKTRGIIRKTSMRYYLFLTRLTGWGQWSIIWSIVLGGYAGALELEKLSPSNDVIASLICFTSPLYLFFALTTWMGSPAYRRILMSKRLAKYGIRRRAITGAVLSVGVIILLMVAPFGRDLYVYLWPRQARGVAR